VQIDHDPDGSTAPQAVRALRLWAEVVPAVATRFENTAGAPIELLAIEAACPPALRKACRDR
jgi:hypothetical protein